MKFNIMGIILMAVAIWLGSFIGSGLASMFGFAGGIVGALVVGFIVYVVYTLVSGGKIGIFNGAIFAVLVYVASMFAGIIASSTGFGGGIAGLFIESVILAVLWGYFGKGTTSPIQVKGSSRKGRR